MRTRYVCHYDIASQLWKLVDRNKIPEASSGYETPREAITLLPTEAVLAIVQATQNEQFIENQVRNDFDKEVMREHLKIINKLIDQ